MTDEDEAPAQQGAVGGAEIANQAAAAAAAAATAAVKAVEKLKVTAPGGPDLRIDAFTPPDDPLKVGKAWEEWLEDITEAMDYHELDADDKKLKALKQFCGKEVKRMIRSLPAPVALPPVDGEAVQESDYAKTIRKLNNHYIPKKNRHYAIFVFNSTRQKRDETIVTYSARLRERARDCEFGEQENQRILDHIVQTITDKALIRKTIHKQWDLDQLLTEASQLEQTTFEITGMKSDPEHTAIAKIRRRGRGAYPSRGFDRSRGQSRGRGFSQNRSSGDRKQKCNYCGGYGTHPPGKGCPAYGQNCLKCGRRGHFSKVCTDGSFHSKHYQPAARGISRGSGSRGRGRYQSVRHHGSEQDEQPDEQLDDQSESFINQALSHMKLKLIKEVKKVSKAEWDATVAVRLAGVPAMMEPDSGSFANIMDEHQFKALIKNGAKVELTPTDVGLQTVQSKLKAKGEFTAIISNEHNQVEAKILVLEGHIQSPPLLGKQTSQDLGFLRIDKEGRLNGDKQRSTTLADPSDDVLCDSIHESQPRLKAVVTLKQDKQSVNKLPPEERYKECFEGIGEIKDIETNQPMEAHLSVDNDADFITQKPRHVPYYLVVPLKKWLEQGIRQGIFEVVPRGEAITWCSPLVVQPKPKFAKQANLEPHQIRASIDMRLVNAHMKRSRIVQAPLLEDFALQFNDCKVFSKLDLRQGYHQLALDEESRKLATFSTPWGNYRPRRLVFGAKSSQDVFDQIMQRIFGDMPRCLNQRDDILVGGRDVKEHDATLEEVFRRAKQYNITFNPDKCQFRTPVIDFFGHRFTKDGLQADPEKVKAIVKMGRPRSKEEVRSFLGMTGYLDDYIPNYSATVAPLRELTKNKTKFIWGKQQQQAFKVLKEQLSSNRTMAYFHTKKPIVVRTEASFNEGIAAALFQPSNGRLRPVHFISRTLSDPEKRYSQTEKDMLAIKFAASRFEKYLIGAPKFTIITSHKPLIPMFSKPLAKLPPRIEKWMMMLQDLDYEVKYEPGKDAQDPLDYLSRHPLPDTDPDSIEIGIKWIHNQEHAIISKDIQEATLSDKILQLVLSIMKRGSWEMYRRDPDIGPYYNIREDLYEAQGMVMRDGKIVLPAKLQRKTAIIAHLMGHLGETKTKERMRRKYWFPQMDKMIKSLTANCFECQVNTRSFKHEPVKPTEIPQKPWDVLAADFGGPYPDGHMNLVVVDKRTRYPVVKEVPSTQFKSVRPPFKQIFATYGTPSRIETDGGPPFNGNEFTEFSKQEGFNHHLVTPDHARANGEAERFMRTLNKAERIIAGKTRDKGLRRGAIQELLTAYRDSPHPATGITPYEGMFNRPIRTKLGTNLSTVPEEEEVNKKDAEYKEKMKKRNRNTKEHNLVRGDCVLVEQKKLNKWTTPYEPVFYSVINVNGSTVTARRATDSRIITRDGSKFKLANNIMREREDLIEDVDVQQTDNADDDGWREQLLMETTPTVETMAPPSQPAAEPMPETPRPAQAQTPRRADARPAARTPTPRERPVRARRAPRRFDDYIRH